MLSQRRPREAADVFGRVLLRDATHPEARAGLERARSAAGEAERQLDVRLEEARRAFLSGEGDRARRLLEQVVAQGGDRDRARALLDRVDGRAGRLRPQTAGAAAAGPREVMASGPRPGWSRSAVVGIWALGFALLGAGVSASWEDLLGRLARTPAPQSAESAPSTFVAAPRPGERALAEARRLLEQGDAAGALRRLERVTPDEPAYPFARQLRTQAARALAAAPSR